MDAFKLHTQVIDNYRAYLSSFINIADDRIKTEVNISLNKKGFIPDPLVQFNPSFKKDRSLEDLKNENKIHQDTLTTIGSYKLYKHQIEAIENGINGKGFIVTSGTGSGKSLTFLATIFNKLFGYGQDKPSGVKAILVYPMNALINSQEEEIKKYAINYLKSFLPENSISEENKTLDNILFELEQKTNRKFPITFAQYTGQVNDEKRKALVNNPPDIILTNYMMLELIMTRQSEAWLRESMKTNLNYLVFDELHTYRGRQGSDVSMLIRRINSWCENEIVSIGTSATMSSEGSPIQKKEKIAEVASKIFGKSFQTNQIIGEHLITCTNGFTFNKSELINAIERGVDLNANEEEFISHPLTNWIELNIALKNNEGTLERGQPKTIRKITEELEKITNYDIHKIELVLNQLLKWAELLNEKNRKGKSGKSFLPFRFHQFISQTSIVSVTLESRATRQITIQAGRYIKNKEGDEMTLFPVLFSRYSGVDFICVEKNTEHKLLKPRNPSDAFPVLTQKNAKGDHLNEDSFKYGYIVLDEGEDFWYDNPVSIAPLAWLKANEIEFKPFYEWQMPIPIYFDRDGNYSNDEIYPLKGYFISAKLRIDPTAGVIYEDPKTNENTKLMSLGNEGRSTATTIMSYAVVDSLFKQGESYQDQKLLSFTDNRQDASLQAGHFNDFLSSVKLRSAIYKALVKNTDGLDVHVIAERVFNELKLNEKDYAVNAVDDAIFSDPENEKAVKAYILYRILQDLKRGWKYVLPNLEQTGLLQIEYFRLKELCTLNKHFEGLYFFEQLESSAREEIIFNVLNFFRTKFSVAHRFLLNDRAEIEALLKNKLDDKKLWSLEHNEYIDSPFYMVNTVPGRSKQKGIYFASMGPRSGIGKYIKRKMYDLDIEKPSEDDFKVMIESLCNILVRAQLLIMQENLRGENATVNGYLLKTDILKWKKGDEVNVPFDETRFNSYREIDIKPNIFFQNLYKTDFTKYPKEILGREHTGQLNSQKRIEREDDFRKGNISSLFCSPTMELGIDIANLNIVHMRNVPPNPANYAQRSGRAGRSGQTAVVFTYCSSYSAHDQNYFNAQETMVAGTVSPPRIDLLNEELLITHFNAYILMELSIAELKSSVADIIDLSDERNIQIKASVLHNIDVQLEGFKDKWIVGFSDIIQHLIPDLNSMWWFTEHWFNQKINSFKDRFSASFDRWIAMYLAARKMVIQARIVMDDQVIKSDSDEKRDAKRQHAIGLNQISLLKNDSEKTNSNESEFYIFRYLAAEGFLPGYNFTRLPIRTFIGYKHNDQGEYLSRPRGVALKEFGPHNTIYHDGNKYQINRMSVIEVDKFQKEMKISKETGYAFLNDEARVSNVDPITHSELKGDIVENIGSLIEMTESEARPIERISCIEEERNSSGFIIEQYFTYTKGIEHTKQLVIRNGTQELLNLIYDKSTELISLNRKSRRAPTEFFPIDKRNGKWLTEKELEKQDNQDNRQNVMLFVRDTADTLYIQPLENIGVNADQTITLCYALKRGIERLFQVEESEIGVQMMGNKEKPNIMLYESAEGSLGILSQLIEEPLQLKNLFVEAYKSIHYDPETRTETEKGKSLTKATYEDLLSYYNQRHHELLDRHSIADVLALLMDCDASSLQKGKSHDDQYQYLLGLYDKSSGSELPLIKYLHKHKLALPDKAQVFLDNFFISADFVYNTKSGAVLIFCDGAVHDSEAMKESDKHKRTLLREAGFDVIEWHYLESVEDLVNRRKDVFRKIN
jgi:superfamily II DNA/RNA helicase